MTFIMSIMTRKITIEAQIYTRMGDACFVCNVRFPIPMCPCICVKEIANFMNQDDTHGIRKQSTLLIIYGRDCYVLILLTLKLYWRVFI